MNGKYNMRINDVDPRFYNKTSREAIMPEVSSISFRGAGVVHPQSKKEWVKDLQWTEGLSDAEIKVRIVERFDIEMVIREYSDDRRNLISNRIYHYLEVYRGGRIWE